MQGPCGRAHVRMRMAALWDGPSGRCCVKQPGSSFWFFVCVVAAEGYRWLAACFLVHAWRRDLPCFLRELYPPPATPLWPADSLLGFGAGGRLPIRNGVGGFMCNSPSSSPAPLQQPGRGTHREEPTHHPAKASKAQGGAGSGGYCASVYGHVGLWACSVSARVCSASVRVNSISVRVRSVSARVCSASVRVRSVSVRVRSVSARVRSVSARVCSASVRARSVSERTRRRIRAVLLPNPRGCVHFLCGEFHFCAFLAFVDLPLTSL